jgi:hypothetical protein
VQNVWRIAARFGKEVGIQREEFPSLARGASLHVGFIDPGDAIAIATVHSSPPTMWTTGLNLAPASAGI